MRQGRRAVLEGCGQTTYKKMATISEAGPSLEEILSRHGLKETDLDRECPQSVRDEIALKLDDWEMVGRCLEFSLEKLRDINRENTRQELCRIALLDTWGKREGKRATYLKLAGALHRRQRCDLVEFLCAQLKSTLSVVPLALSGSWKVPPANGQQRQVQQYQNGSSSTGTKHTGNLTQLLYMYIIVGAT